MPKAGDRRALDAEPIVEISSYASLVTIVAKFLAEHVVVSVREADVELPWIAIRRDERRGRCWSSFGSCGVERRGGILRRRRERQAKERRAQNEELAHTDDPPRIPSCEFLGEPIFAFARETCPC